ncbi:MAG: alpha-L-fucosidase [Planctomycetes bacterium]|nr:alpha-L-fucosidase [Planctomycetota bacterium]
MHSVDEFSVEPVSAAAGRVSPGGIKAFRDAARGLTAHWGLYSTLAQTHGTEWIYFSDRIPCDVYRKQMDLFNPVRFVAEEWADLLLESGFRFFMITAKHHDGFCLWDTDSTDFKISACSFRRDILAELAPALRDRGIALHFYYSLVDWTHPAYRNDWPAYVDYYQAHVKELCSRFGKLGGILFDGCWPRIVFDDDDETSYFAARGNWDLQGTYALIHDLQPDAVITNNSHVPPLNGEDYQVWELDLPGENTVGFNCTQIGSLPTACWWNLNSGWSYQPWRHNVKSPAQIVSTMKSVADRGAVFLLNVGPRPFGDIHPEEQAVLRALPPLLR